MASRREQQSSFYDAPYGLFTRAAKFTVLAAFILDYLEELRKGELFHHNFGVMEALGISMLAMLNTLQNAPALILMFAAVLMPVLAILSCVRALAFFARPDARAGFREFAARSIYHFRERADRWLCDEE